MARHLSLLVSAVLLCTSVAVVAWLRVRDEPHDTSVSVAPDDAWDMSPSDVTVDPVAAVATIHELRSQFGSVLSNTELEVVYSDASGVDDSDGPSSFDDFLWEAAGMPNPFPDEVDVVPTRHAARARLSADQMARALRETATLLDEQSRQAGEMGDVAQQQRFSGLATLLRAEADVLSPVRQADRDSGPRVTLGS